MKFYNPWKPHIVVDNKCMYYIRILSHFSWEYYNEYYGFNLHKILSTSTPSLEEATQLLGLSVNYLNEVNNHKRISKIKDKVIH